MKRLANKITAFAALLSIAGCQASSAEPDVEGAMESAADFFQDELEVEGSYVWEYKASDLSRRRGEGITTASQGWTEPPGTPAVGLAYLAAFKATGKQAYINAALETGQALIRTQLETGGWQGLLEFDLTARQSWCYRVDKDSGRPACKAIEDNKKKNSTSTDDNVSQASLIFLIRLDQELGGSVNELREAVTYGLGSFLKAQYENGAWPHRIDGKTSDRDTGSASKAGYPVDWPHAYVKPEGQVYVTNDHLQRDVIRMFLLAYGVYGETDYLSAAKRGGDFLLAAQMPEPQPGWAQTYNKDLEPIWGRRFEPPAIASNETAGAVQALLELYGATGDQRYLDGAATAVRWLERSQLPDGDWARFYELENNSPLYVDKDYKIAYSKENVPDHYTFSAPFEVPDVIEHYLHVAAYDQPKEDALAPDKTEVAAMVEALDWQGRWIENGKILSGTFVRRMTALAHFTAAEKGLSLPDYLQPIAHQLDR